MSDLAFFVIKWIVLTVAFFGSLLPTFFKVRDDSHRFTRLGQASLGFAVAAFAFGASLDYVQRDREAVAQAAAEARSQAKADARTKHQEQVLRAESDSLKALQRTALLQMDSAAAVSRLLTTLQRSAIREFGFEPEPFARDLGQPACECGHLASHRG